MLALSLAVVVLALVGVSIHVYMGVASKSRDQVEEAQLARVLLQRIADDLRNAVPFQPPASSTSSSSSSSSSGASGTTDSSGTSSTSSTAPLSGGIYGTAQAVQIETARRPKATLASLKVVANDPSQPARLSDLRVVSYSLGAPMTVDLSQTSPPQASTGGLYRHEQDRAEFFYGSQNGSPDTADPATELLAPEVVDFQITYYGGTAGTSSTATSSSGTSGSSSTSSTSGGSSTVDTTTDGTTNETQWDSTQQGMLPSAVRITISLRRDAPKSTLNLLDEEKRPPVVYSLLVSLPNASVDTSQQLSKLPLPPAATPFVSIVPAGGEGAGGRGAFGRNGQGARPGGREGGPGEGGGRGRGRGRGRGEGEQGGERGAGRGGERGAGERGAGERGAGERGGGERGGAGERGAGGRGEGGRGGGRGGNGGQGGGRFGGQGGGGQGGGGQGGGGQGGAGQGGAGQGGQGGPSGGGRNVP